MKRFLSIILTAAMILCSMPYFAYADDEGSNGEDPYGDVPVIETIDKYEFVTYNEASAYSHDDPHYKDGTLTARFRVDGSHVYRVNANIFDPDSYKDFTSETTVRKGSDVLYTSTAKEAYYAACAGSVVQEGDVVTVSLKKTVDRDVFFSICVTKYTPLSKSTLPKSLSVRLNKTVKEADPTEPADYEKNYYYAEYSIDDESVADMTVTYAFDKTSIKVKGKQPGTAVITATLPNGNQYFCNVTVGSGLQYTSKSIYIKESFANELIGYSGTVKWSSSDKKIATVSSSGVIKGVKKGKATITAKAGKKTYKCVVTVKNPQLSANDLIPIVGQTYQLEVKGGSGKISWASSDKSVASVSSTGLITAKKEGECTITATRNGIKCKCYVEVVKEMTLSRSSASIILGADGNNETLYLGATGVGDITWTSEDESIASVTVDKYGDAAVTPEKEGSTIIWAERNGSTAQCIVNVTYQENVTYADFDDWDSVTVYSNDSGDGWWIKVDASLDGYIRVRFDKGPESYVHLCDMKGNRLSEDIYVAEDDRYAYFGVKGDRSYYIVYDGPAADDAFYINENCGYSGSISISDDFIDNKCGYSKKAAKTLKKNKAVKGIVFAGDERSHWYKFKLTKRSKVKVTYRTLIHQYSYITLYKGSKKVRGGGPYWEDYDETATLTSDPTLDPGTYYIRIQPDPDYYCTGWYTIKWK